jgi:hypothetical protein
MTKLVSGLRVQIETPCTELRRTCRGVPRITIKIGDEVSAILDIGCELTLKNKNLYKKIKPRGNQYLEPPAQHLTLVKAFNDKSPRVRRQIFVPVK